MKGQDDNIILDAMKLCHIIRYQGTRHLKDESVAEHSFIVASIIYSLRNTYNFNLEKALVAGLLHDLAESSISDVPHPVKKKYPQIEEALNLAENDYLSQFIDEDIIEIIQDFNNAHEAKTAEALVLAYADAKSVDLYAQEEALCGVSYFKDVTNKTNIRIALCKKALEKFLKS